MAKKVNLDVAQTLNITCRRGDTFQLNMTLKDSAGTALVLDGSGSDQAYKFAMQIRNSADQDGAVGLLASTVEGLPEGASDYTTIQEITGDANGAISVVIDDIDMKSFASGRYVYDLQYRIPEGAPNSKDLTKTILKGAFVVNEDVTEDAVSAEASQQRLLNPLGR
jgi:hypothetical protein